MPSRLVGLTLTTKYSGNYESHMLCPNFMKKILIFLILNIFVSTSNLFSQTTGIGINITGAPANSKALLDVDAKGMNQKAGLLLPRMTTADRNNIPTPIPESLLIYNTDTHCFEAYYNGTWVAWGCLGGCQLPDLPTAGTNVPSQTQIIWNWNIVSGASGYKWATISTYSSATDNGLSTTYTQTGLICNTSYTIYVWAYNTCGNSFDLTLSENTSACSFTCGSILTDNRDAKTYATVQIGTQCWMSQNLNVGTKIIGSLNQINNGTIEKYCYQDNDNNCNIYGGLYQWNEMMQYVTTESTQGICPDGWHLPSDAEWYTLENFVDPTINDPSAINWRGTDGGTNLMQGGNSGFNALLGGSHLNASNGTWWSLGQYGDYWTSSAYDSSFAWGHSVINSSTYVFRGSIDEINGFSVRCLKD